MRQNLLRLQHGVVRAAHPGVNRMYAFIRRHYNWESMAADVNAWVARLCVSRHEQDCTKATHGDAYVVPGDGPLRALVYGPPRTPDRDQDRERSPPDHRRAIL